MCNLTVTMTHSPAWRRRQRDPKLTRSEARSSRNHKLQRNYRTEFPLPDASQRQNRHIARDTKSNTRRKVRCNDCQGEGRKPRRKSKLVSFFQVRKFSRPLLYPEDRGGDLIATTYIASLCLPLTTLRNPRSRHNATNRRNGSKLFFQHKRSVLFSSKLKLAQQTWHATS